MDYPSLIVEVTQRTGILGRLRERSTWLGLIGLATAAGLAMTPEQAESVATVGAALAGLLATLLPDK